jgi:hypothetical protein
VNERRVIKINEKTRFVRDTLAKIGRRIHVHLHGIQVPRWFVPPNLHESLTALGHGFNNLKLVPSPCPLCHHARTSLLRPMILWWRLDVAMGRCGVVVAEGGEIMNGMKRDDAIIMRV